ncbi:MAG: hypothetical protein ABIG73_01040 [Patescibacteria group bacterium]
MGGKGITIKTLKENPDGTKLAKVGKVKVTICPYKNHPDKFSDLRIPGYYEQPWPDGCLNCHFCHQTKDLSELKLVCGLTLNDRGYFSGVSPLGKCKKYVKGKSLFP